MLHAGTENQSTEYTHSQHHMAVSSHVYHVADMFAARLFHMLLSIWPKAFHQEYNVKPPVTTQASKIAECSERSEVAGAKIKRAQDSYTSTNLSVVAVYACASLTQAGCYQCTCSMFC